jgi:hypothetical protein
MLRSFVVQGSRPSQGGRPPLSTVTGLTEYRSPNRGSGSSSYPPYTLLPQWRHGPNDHSTRFSSQRRCILSRHPTPTVQRRLRRSRISCRRSHARNRRCIAHLSCSSAVPPANRCRFPATVAEARSARRPNQHDRARSGGHGHRRMGRLLEFRQGRHRLRQRHRHPCLLGLTGSPAGQLGLTSASVVRQLRCGVAYQQYFASRLATYHHAHDQSQ